MKSVRIGRGAGALAAGMIGLSFVPVEVRAASMQLDDAALQPQTRITSTYRASMPAASSGGGNRSHLQLSGAPAAGGGGGGANLGTFDIVINPTPALAGNAPALAAFNRAAQRWESYISDPITVNVNADFSALGPGIIGSTNSVGLQASYTTVRNAMVADAGDEPDDNVTALLPTAAQYTSFLPTGFALNGNLSLSKANAKALGFTGLDAQFGTSDGNIAFSTGFTFDFDNSNGVSPGTVDFESVAAHEIGHLLGFFSEGDTVDFLRSQNQTTSAVQPSTLDLYRFDDAAANDPDTLLPGEGSFTTEPRSLVPGNIEHFDQLGNLFGGSEEVLLSTGLTQGDGRQTSHWKDNLGLGLMDPTLANGEVVGIGPNDLRAMDLIGYDIAVVAVPEPSGAAALAAGAGLLAARRHRRRRA